MLNNWVGEGRMVVDPKIGTTKGDKRFANFRIAVNRDYKVDEEYPTDFFSVSIFGPSADFLEDHVEKGDLVSVTGSIEVKTYEDKDGNERTDVHVAATRVYLLRKKGDGAAQEDDVPAAKKSTSGSSKPVAKKKVVVEEDEADLSDLLN